MVSGGRALRAADGRLRSAAAARRRSRRALATLRLRRPQRRSVCRAGALTVAEAFTRFAGIDLLATLDGEAGDRNALAAAAAGAGIATAPDDTWADIFSRVLVETIEPATRQRPRRRSSTEYPRCEAALAAPQARRSARRRTFRALCLRRGARQRLRRTDRPGRTAPPLRDRDGREAAHLRRALSRSTRISSPRWRICRQPAASRSASTGWSCWPPAHPASSRCSGRRWRNRACKRHLVIPEFRVSEISGIPGP